MDHIERLWVAHTERSRVAHIGRLWVAHTTRSRMDHYDPVNDRRERCSKRSEHSVGASRARNTFPPRNPVGHVRPARRGPGRGCASRHGRLDISVTQQFLDGADVGLDFTLPT